ncbi:DUF1488 family protein [Vibrio fluvialis]|nr:DUF1488 family protein [Vibrio fluvialis]EKO3461400.1 DUF1488 family protein [Vibrio fluvialis]EKO4003705.1 DUF1488 family protein [Vibrio fluvialis]
MENTWTIEDEWDWRMQTDSIRFYLSDGQERHIFEITRTALVDYFHTEDTKERALDLFEQHKERIMNVALKVLFESKDDGVHVIKLETCQRLGL